MFWSRKWGIHVPRRTGQMWGLRKRYFCTVSSSCSVILLGVESLYWKQTNTCCELINLYCRGRNYNLYKKGINLGAFDYLTKGWMPKLLRVCFKVQHDLTEIFCFKRARFWVFVWFFLYKKKGFGALSKKIKEARKAFIFPCLFVPGVISSHNWSILH